MGKTAIARMVGLAKLSDGWELHECTRPDQLWDRFARDRPQVFVADDAFGSTEYRPEAAERWAVELDRVLRAMDERHWLIWTSRPTPAEGRTAANPPRARRRAVPEAGRGADRRLRPAGRGEGAHPLPAREGGKVAGGGRRCRPPPRLEHRQPRALHAGADPPLRRRQAPAAGPPRAPGRRRARGADRLRDRRADGGDGRVVPRTGARAPLAPDRIARRAPGPRVRARAGRVRAPAFGASVRTRSPRGARSAERPFRPHARHRCGHVGASELARSRDRPARARRAAPDARSWRPARSTDCCWRSRPAAATPAPGRCRCCSRTATGTLLRSGWPRSCPSWTSRRRLAC